MTRPLVVVGLAVGLATPAWSQGFDPGLDAYERGDCAAALATWQSLAEQGYARAQNNLGVMYYGGKGVPQNYAVAITLVPQSGRRREC